VGVQFSPGPLQRKILWLKKSKSVGNVRELALWMNQFAVGVSIGCRIPVATIHGRKKSNAMLVNHLTRRPDMAKKQKFTLWNENGEWCCSVPQLRGSMCFGKTPTEAVSRAEIMLADFNEFTDHNYGRCDPEKCSRCSEGKRERGCLKKIQEECVKKEKHHDV